MATAIAPPNAAMSTIHALPNNRMAASAPTDAPPDTPVPPCQSADDVMVMVLGGAGKHSMYVPTFGETRSVTHALRLADGSLARSVEEFRAS